MGLWGWRDAAGLWAKVPGRPMEDCYRNLHLNVTHTLRGTNRWVGPTGRRVSNSKADCGVCPLRSQCVAARYGAGRTVALHPQEALLQQARDFQRSEGFAEYGCARRPSIAWRAGATGGPYFGRAKTRFQLLMAATVANLTLVATKMGMISPAPGSSHDGPASPRVPIVTTQFILAAANGSLLADLQSTGYPPRHPVRGFSAGFLGTWHRRCREDGLAPLLVGQRSHRKPAPQTSVRPSHKKSGTDFRPCLTSKWRFGPHTPNHHGWRAICALPPIPARIFGS